MPLKPDPGRKQICLNPCSVELKSNIGWAATTSETTITSRQGQKSQSLQLCNFLYDTETAKLELCQPVLLSYITHKKFTNIYNKTHTIIKHRTVCTTGHTQ